MAVMPLNELLKGVTRFGKLVVVYEGPTEPRNPRGFYRTAICSCDCGGSITLRVWNLMYSARTDCGCVVRRRVKHGEGSPHGKTREFESWRGMRERCNNPNMKCYSRYGGRGITVCDRWEESYAYFLEDMGRRPDGTSLDRIDNDGNYEPGNCRWATAIEQRNNQRRAKRKD